MAFDKRKALQNALAYTQQGKWDRAIAEYQSILKADPRDVTVCNNLGDLFARAGKTADAIDQYFKLGELYRADGLSVKAIAVYKKIAKLDPARTEAYLACADLYWEQGLVGEAKIQMATVVEHFSRSGEAQKLIDAYKRLSQFDPSNAAVLARLADLMVREGMREAAAGEYERAAQAAQAAGQAAEAKRLLQKARDLSPGTRESRAAAAERLLGEGKLAEAIEILKEVTGADPENAKAWRALGEAQASQGTAQEAVASLQRAVTLGVPEGEIARPLGRMLLRAGQAEDAVSLCQRLTEAGLASGDPDAAITFCRELAAEAPQLVALHAHLAAMLQNLGRIEEARSALRSLATAQESSGQSEAAVATYHRLVEMDPSDAHARARLEALEPPAPAPALETPASQEPSAEPSVESPRGPEVDIADLSASSLEALGLSLGAEDAALLLEEPDTVVAAGDAVEAAPAAAEAGTGEAAEAADETFQATAWLTQELQSIDLDEATTSSHAETGAWDLGGAALELEEISAHFGGSGLGPLEADTASPEEEIPAFPQGDSSLLEAAAMGLADAAQGPVGLPVDLSPPAAGPRDRSEEDALSGQIAEQLAEADVYQKYGLEEKARERLLEVVHMAPDNLTARRRLKAIYRERRQTDEACAETLAIARILRERHQEEAAAAEIRDGLAMAPDRQDLLQFLVGATTSEDSARGAPAPDLLPEAVPRAGDVEAPAAGDVRLAFPGAAGEGAAGAPPPDVPLLFDLDDATLGAEAAVDAGGAPAPVDDQVLPTELQALLDEKDEREVAPTEAPAEAAPEPDRVLADDVAEAEFYLSQGMIEEARAVHHRLWARDPQHPAVGALAAQIERAGTAKTEPVAPAAEPAVAPGVPPVAEPAEAERIRTAAPEATAQDSSPQFSVASEAPAGAPAGFVNLGAELSRELEGSEPEPAAPPPGPVVDGLLRELQKGVREQLDEKDYETHYNLGIAYKEMELYDEAIQEFRLTAREAKRALECADLMGLCYLAKGQPEQAIQDLQIGLAIEGHPADAYHALRYDLGTAFEAAGDLPRALEQFEILQAEGARFLDLRTRIEALRARLPKPSPPATEGEKPRRKKKISFI